MLLIPFAVRRADVIESELSELPVVAKTTLYGLFSVILSTATAVRAEPVLEALAHK
jgi:hypothetical protein